MDTKQKLSSMMMSEHLLSKVTEKALTHSIRGKALNWFTNLLQMTVAFAVSTSLAYANPSPANIPKALSPEKSVVLNGSIETWHKRAEAWYTSSDVKQRRRQMREMSRPLKRSCYYCHTRNFKDYIEETYLISLQMMAISVEQDLSCKDCHIGQRALNTLGAKSLIQWRYTVNQNKDCTDCHEEKGKFKRLTDEGKKSIPTLIHFLQSQNTKLEVSNQVVDDFLKQLIHLKEQQSEVSKKLLVPNTELEPLMESTQAQDQTNKEN